MAKFTVGKYLARRLEQVGLTHVFGVPGDYVLGFYDLLVDSKLDLVGTCTEIGAGYAADAYARVHGVGCICVTYCVGGLNALNAVAGAYAEKSPLIVISGAPGLDERTRSPLLHHLVRDYNTQFQIYQKVTVACVVIDNAVDAPRQIDETIATCLRLKRPVYIELPRDLVNEPCTEPSTLKKIEYKSDPAALAEAIEEASTMLRAAKRPVILAGVEIHRFGLQQQLLDLVKRTGYPIAATLLGKSVISERHPQYLGIYEGAMGHTSVRRAVESSDCLLVLGAFLTDIDFGGLKIPLKMSCTINARAERISIRHHHFDHVELPDFIEGLCKASLGPPRPKSLKIKNQSPVYKARRNSTLTVRRFFRRINDYLEDDNVVICDIGDSLFGAADLTIHRRTEFISPAFYTSMGFAVPAAIGCQLAKRKYRPIVIVGDGAFQMTGMELSTIASRQLNPIIFVLNNKGYTTERLIHEGPYNDINDWAYHLLPQIVREGWGCEVRTEGELEEALTRARQNTACFSIINIHLDSNDGTEALNRLAKRLGRRVGTKK